MSKPVPFPVKAPRIELDEPVVIAEPEPVVPPDWKEPIKKEYIEKFRILPYTKEQIELFSGEEFQRGFLTEKPERYEDISCGGIVVHPEIRKEFSYLWEGEGMGFFKMNKQ